jgi:hypothetical protein
MIVDLVLKMYANHSRHYYKNGRLGAIETT